MYKRQSLGRALDDLARETVGRGRHPHHCVVIGAVGAEAGCGPHFAAATAAHASVAGALVAGGSFLGLTGSELADLDAAVSVDIEVLATASADRAAQPFSALPAPGCLGIEYLAVAHAAGAGGTLYAS